MPYKDKDYGRAVALKRYYKKKEDILIKQNIYKEWLKIVAVLPKCSSIE
jgi:hypothetical protein